MKKKEQGVGELSEGIVKMQGMRVGGPKRLS